MHSRDVLWTCNIGSQLQGIAISLHRCPWMVQGHCHSRAHWRHCILTARWPLVTTQAQADACLGWEVAVRISFLHRATERRSWGSVVLLGTTSVLPWACAWVSAKSWALVFKYFGPNSHDERLYMICFVAVVHTLRQKHRNCLWACL